MIMKCPNCSYIMESWEPSLLSFERQEQPMAETTTMHNVWDQDGNWMGVKRNTKCFSPGWTYDLVDKSEYPEMPIKDGVYRVSWENGNDGNVYFLERKNGEWCFANGSNFGQGVSDLKIIEKYKAVK